MGKEKPPIAFIFKESSSSPVYKIRGKDIYGDISANTPQALGEKIPQKIKETIQFTKEAVFAEMEKTETISLFTPEQREEFMKTPYISSQFVIPE